MKKQLLTFCAVALLATGAPVASAATTSNGGEVLSYNKSVKIEKRYIYTKWFMPFTYASINLQEKPATEEATVVEDKPVVKEKPAVEKVEPVVKEKPAVEKAEPVVKEKPAVEKAELVVEEKPAVEKVEPVVKEKPAVEKVEPVVVEKPVAEKPAPVVEEKPTTENTTTASVQTEVEQLEAAVVVLTNNEREKAGLAPLQTDAPLMAAAREKSQDMKNYNYFSHTSPTFGSPFDRLKALGISYKNAGENIAKGQRSAEEVVTAWMNSEGHRANILNADYTHIGVGFVKEGYIWTQQFIKK